ncbi:MAG: hypothetical protein KGJ57_17315 [Sphingomonadales bacterium]|nr:hypothetical protein [Sphingomonadales bacterium]MDE2171157.1 hypothetical protein [Sphingomonadales bacterium]
MERLDSPLIAQAILSAPGWARVGITHPKASLREEAARELAECIAGALAAPADCPDEGQPCLPL